MIHFLFVIGEDTSLHPAQSISAYRLAHFAHNNVSHSSKPSPWQGTNACHVLWLHCRAVTPGGDGSGRPLHSPCGHRAGLHTAGARAAGLDPDPRTGGQDACTTSCCRCAVGLAFKLTQSPITVLFRYCTEYWGSVHPTDLGLIGIMQNLSELHCQSQPSSHTGSYVPTLSYEPTRLWSSRKLWLETTSMQDPHYDGI